MVLAYSILIGCLALAAMILGLIIYKHSLQEPSEDDRRYTVTGPGVHVNNVSRKSAEHLMELHQGCIMKAHP